MRESKHKMSEPFHQVRKAMIKALAGENNEEKENVLSQNIIKMLFEGTIVVYDEREEEEEKGTCARRAADTVNGPDKFDVARGEEARGMECVLISDWNKIAIHTEKYGSITRHSHEVSCLASFPVFRLRFLIKNFGK